jgi:hypothetical protein
MLYFYKLLQLLLHLKSKLCCLLQLRAEVSGTRMLLLLPLFRRYEKALFRLYLAI